MVTDQGQPFPQQEDKMPGMTVVYTDGACEKNPGGRGGWGWVVDAKTFDLGADPSTTNQRMEIQAALEAVRALPRPLTVWSDSTYVVNCFEKSWWRKWQDNGWKNSKKEPVSNRDLWEPLIEAAADEVDFRWVKGHSGVQLNEVADRLATAGMLGQPVTKPLDMAALVARSGDVARAFVVSATWRAACKACGEHYTVGTSVTKSDVGWVHAECAAS
jgi:ribonuclease HI